MAHARALDGRQQPHRAPVLAGGGGAKAAIEAPRPSMSGIVLVTVANSVATPGAAADSAPTLRL
jgi:hypothetical protein